ncbi:MAG TPA: hypothetical protein IAB50_01295 [Candidatus Faecivicinus avistercoris]|nr:hypothetical protein [Candidatus Faecivicinus avistercoris]
MAVLKINGVDAPSPSELKVRIFDVGSSGERSASGVLVVDRVAVKRELTLRWAHLTPAQLSALMEDTGGEVFFSATYPDPELGTARTANFRCAERSSGVLLVRGGEPVWTDVEMTWTEK